MKNKNFFQSVKRAAIGFVSGFRSERNFKVYTVIVLVFLALNIITGSGMYDYIIMLSLVCAAFSAEYFNTALERLCDSFCSKKDDDVKFIKDVAAGAVLAIGIAFFSAEGVILAKNILC